MGLGCHRVKNQKSADIILKHFSTVVSILAGGTVTLGADLIRPTTSTSARNAVQAPAQIGCTSRSTAWVNKARTDTKVSKSLVRALLCPALPALTSPCPLRIFHDVVMHEVFLATQPLICDPSTLDIPAARQTGRRPHATKLLPFQ